MTAELVCSATNPAWPERRREGITATDIVTIAGLVTYDSPWALYHRKLGLLPELEQSDRMRLGSWLQDSIAIEWSSRRLSPNWTDNGGLYRSEARHWQIATPDSVVRESSLDQPRAVLECKTSATRQGWGPDGSDEVPAHVRAQVLWQMDTLGVGTGHVAVVFLPSGEFRSYTISHHESHPGRALPPSEHAIACPVCREIADLRDLGFVFWRRLQDKEPPDLDGLEVTTDALRYLHPAPGGQVEIDPYLSSAYDGEAIALRDAKQAQQRFINEIRLAMGDAHEATVDGRVVFRRTIGKRAGYTVPPGETDVLRRIGKDKDDG